jgi:hypothetical protein
MTNFNPRATAAALLLAFGGLVGADDAPKPGVPLAPASVPTYRAKQILGTKITIQNNVSLGTTEDLVFDDAGNLDYLIVATADNKLITVPWEAVTFDLERKTGSVSLTPAVVKTIPTFTTTTYPLFYAPTYRAEVYKTYGLTPRELRRLERRIP